MSWLFDKVKDFGSSIANATSLFGDNGILTNPSGSWDRFKNGETNAVNSDIAEKNLAHQKQWNAQQMQFQRENFDYQKALQERVFAREDSSYQRTVNDMRAAGLSPLIMNGTNGAGEALQTSPIGEGLSAPQLNYQHTDMGDLNAISSILNSDWKGLFSFDKQMKSMDEDNRRKKLENDFLEATYEDRTKTSKFSALMAEYQAADASRQNDFNSYFGINSNMSDKERATMYALKSLGYSYKDIDKVKDKVNAFTNNPLFDFLFGSSAKNGSWPNIGHSSDSSASEPNIWELDATIKQLDEQYGKEVKKIQSIPEKQLKNGQREQLLKEAETRYSRRRSKLLSEGKYGRRDTY